MKRKVSVVLLVGAAVVLSGACAKPPEVQIRKADEVISLKKEIPIEGIDLFLLIDESGSMYGAQGTDPDGLRYEAGKYLLQNLLVKKADPRFPHRISLIHFGDEAIAQPLRRRLALALNLFAPALVDRLVLALVHRHDRR